MSSRWNRRDILKLLAALPVGAWMARFRAMAAAYAGKVKITRVKAMALKNIAGNCLIRIDTDAGITGFGEAGISGPGARDRIEEMKDLLISKDPLSIEVHFQSMASMMHPHMAHIPTISGIDIALWDIAGKITGLPVSVLLGGPFRDAISLYSHGSIGDIMDPASCREWADRIRKQPEGFTAFKVDVHTAAAIPAARFAGTLDSSQLRRIARGYHNVREAVGDEIDIAVHCHNEFDTPSALAVAKAVEPINPLFLEDPLYVPFSESWMVLKRSTRIPILGGEKLELLRGFKPFIDNQALDIAHPDLAFAGGITGGKKIADYAMLTRTPVALHNVGSLVLCYANAQFGAAIHNFYRSESALGRPTRHVENMAAGNPPVVKNGSLAVVMAPGLGLNLNMDYLRANLADGEPWWE
jgi:L-alanine-DL-glutamate epimerase-like enolase superfamily enzyme